jgi:hypothetical protein
MRMEEELFEVLVKTNQANGNKVDDNLLKEIMVLVKRSPLSEDRSRCQDQIELLIKQYKRRPNK